jgi:hypothetical protein
MATLTLDFPDALLPEMRAMAAERGYPNTNAGAKALCRDELRRLFREYRLLVAQRQVAATVDAAIAQANTDAGGIT